MVSFRWRFVLSTLLVSVLLPVAVWSQEQRSPADQRAATEAAIARARAALAPVARIVGQWEGDAHMSRGAGQSLTLRQSEDITWGASGTVVMIKGTGRSLEAANKGEIVFEAAAVVWFDAETGTIRMQTHTDGRSLVVEPEVRPDTLIWGFKAGGGQIRYTIALGDDTYHEIGEFLRPGSPPVKTFEMTLKRK